MSTSFIETFVARTNETIADRGITIEHERTGAVHRVERVEAVGKYSVDVYVVGSASPIRCNVRPATGELVFLAPFALTKRCVHAMAELIRRVVTAVFGAAAGRRVLCL